MRIIILFISLLLFTGFTIPGDKVPGDNFKEEQKKNVRVRKAYELKSEYLSQLLEKKDLELEDLNIHLRAYKTEGILEVWGKKSTGAKYTLIKSYNFCTKSGDLGPKRCQGDRQIPEGFYYIDRFNPWSNFHLSLGLNYPNKSDRLLGIKTSLGGDIFIHGNCVSIGCIAITDNMIREVYVLAVQASNTGQTKIPVHIFPCRMGKETYKKICARSCYRSQISFWNNLKEGHDLFEKSHQIPQISVNNQGKYIYN